MYYKVLAKFGHVRRNNYILKWIYINANNGRDAALKARNWPRVKHCQKDAIREVCQINYDEYLHGIELAKQDVYFNVHNSTDQRRFNCIDETCIYVEIEKNNYKKKKYFQRLKWLESQKEMIKETQEAWCI